MTWSKPLNSFICNVMRGAHGSFYFQGGDKTRPMVFPKTRHFWGLIPEKFESEKQKRLVKVSKTFEAFDLRHLIIAHEI